MAFPKNVLVVIGTGGMGLAIARRLSSGRQLLLADKSAEQLDAAVKTLTDEGHQPERCEVDVSDFATVEKLAQQAAQLGRIDAIVHTAGLSPDMAATKRIFEVDLLGTANAIDAFFPVISAGTSMVCIGSMAGHMTPTSPEQDAHLATAGLDKLLHHETIDYSVPSATAYGISKKGNSVRVQSACRQWGSKGARINIVSPGVISTAMVRQELEGTAGDAVRSIIAMTPSGRVGTPDDIANAVAFLVGPESSFVNGNDLLVDGGASSAFRWNK